MIIFWLVAGILLVGCAVWLLPVLFTRPDPRDEADFSHADHAVASYNERIAELERDQAEGLLSAEQLEEARHELGRELIKDTRADSGEITQGSGTSVWVAVVMVLIALPAISIPLYYELGQPDMVAGGAPSGVGAAQAATGTGAPAAGGGANGEQMPSIEQMVSGLAARLEQNPDDAQGWMMLGRSYLVLNRLADAEGAYARAYALDASNADVLTGYAEAIARNNNNNLSGRPQELLQGALAAAPGNPKALWLSGISAMQRGDREAAIGHWEALKASNTLNAEETSSLDRMIAEARGESAPPPKARAPAATAPASAAPAQPAVAQSATADGGGQGVSVEVSVSLAPELSSRIAPGDTLFVFARAESGPPMPLAVQRMPAGSFPVTVRLDESMAMMPQMTLASFPKIVVGARVSRSGTARAQPGDLQGLSAGLNPAESPSVQVTIKEVVGQ